jgi:hypothetical protein
MQDVVGSELVGLFLEDLAEVADAAGSTALHVTLDCRTHASQSLLHPGLAKFQSERVMYCLVGLLVDFDVPVSSALACLLVC